LHCYSEDELERRAKELDDELKELRKDSKANKDHWVGRCKLNSVEPRFSRRRK
jgi:hypothetical protein